MKSTFSEFLDKKTREGRKHLKIVSELLQRSGLRIHDFTEAEEGDPYVYVENPVTDSTFKGIRIYHIGDTIAFRIQRDPKTHPYGAAYSLKIPEIFADLVGEYSEEHAGKKVIESVVKELHRFFKISAKIEKDLQTSNIPGADPLNRIVVMNTASDYANLVSGSM